MKSKQPLAKGRVEQNHVGYELGMYAKKVLGVSNRQLQKVVRTKGLLVNGRVSHSKTKLRLGDKVEAFLPRAEQIKIKPASPGQLVILHEDPWLLGVEKPVGVPSYAVEGNNGLANQVAGYFLSQDLQLTPRPLHRLDTPTSGVVVFAKDAQTQTKLSELWQQGKVKRFYWALCQGQLTKPLELTMPLNNRKACTKVRPLHNHGDFTELEVELVTGRTHQIRRHLALIDHPLLGDARYGTKFLENKENTRLALHASRVCFPHPQKVGELTCISSPIPYRDFPSINH